MSENVSQLIVAVVQRGEAEPLIDAAIKAGATGATTTYGRGRGVRERLGMLGKLIQPEKELVLVAVGDDIADAVLDAMVAAGRLDEMGMGMAMTLPIGRVVGLHHEEA